MCLLVIAYRSHSTYPLIVGANRDEFYARPTQAAHFWDDQPKLLAGRDLESGGTWMGITRDGRFAALTNFRDPAGHEPQRPSRGHLVSEFLNGNGSIAAYLQQMIEQGANYNGFNLILGDNIIDDDHSLAWVSNHATQPYHFTPGIYGLSNHLLDTPWEKVTRIKTELSKIIHDNTVSAESIIQLLTDRTRVSDSSLPNTGIGIEFERVLAPIFIEANDYGTRCSTVILVDKQGTVDFIERTYHPDRMPTTTNYSFAVARK